MKQIRQTLQDKELEVKLFQKEIEDSFMLKSKAAKLLNELQGEKQKWEVCKSVAENNLENLEGDVILAAGLVVYLSAFDAKNRN